ncbi:uncharacterized protein LOC126910423 [Daktulosphaira vitifoliae]|uniref:uncharacterized protein LOC126910423 n=1 Tax=Daktulosphaira vitifoliae TaxID=58002 RepID=UPI0021A997B7|nr:uncharacterized protein LOC126910423 [Daktulosphaira vitifoliae]
MDVKSVSMLSVTAVVVLILSVLCQTVFSKPASTKVSRLSKYVKICKINDPQFDPCVNNAMKDIFKYAKTGIPEANIPIMEPFKIPEIDLSIFQALSPQILGSRQNADKFRAFARNVIIHHASELKINRIKTDMKEKKFNLNLNLPFLDIVGEYDVNLILFGLPIKSIGPLKSNVTDTNVECTLKGQLVTRKSDKYLLFDNIDIKVDFKDYNIIIENIFKKDQNLNRALNDMIKSQKMELKKLVMPMVEEIAGKMLLTMLNQIIGSLPYTEWFIVDED